MSASNIAAQTNCRDTKRASTSQDRLSSRKGGRPTPSHRFDVGALIARHQAQIRPVFSDKPQFFLVYRTLHGMRGNSELNAFQANWRDVFLETIRNFPLAEFARDASLLAVRNCNLWVGDYESFPDFVKKETPISWQQAHKRANFAFIALWFADAGREASIPKGRKAEMLHQHFSPEDYLPAWDFVTANAQSRQITDPFAELALRQYATVRGIEWDKDPAGGTIEATQPLYCLSDSSPDETPPPSNHHDAVAADAAIESLLLPVTRKRIRARFGERSLIDILVAAFKYREFAADVPELWSNLDTVHQILARVDRKAGNAFDHLVLNAIDGIFMAEVSRYEKTLNAAKANHSRKRSPRQKGGLR